MKNVADIYPVSPLQQGLIFQSLYAPESGEYLVQVVCAMRGSLDPVAFQRAWEQVIERHTILRTSFIWEDLDEALQVVRSEVHLPWQKLDWSDYTSDEQQELLDALLASDRARPFDLQRAPLMRVTLIKLSEDEFKFLWSHHHLLLDGWSGFVIIKEVFDLYGAIVERRQPALPAAPPFREYISWLQRQDMKEAEQFWRGKLKDITATKLPLTDQHHSSSTGANRKPRTEMHYVPSTTTATLKQLARRHELTLNALVQGAWAILLSRYIGEPAVVIGTVVSGRPPELNDVENMVGPFINTLPLYINVDGQAQLLPWLMELQSEQAAMRAFEYSPLVEIQGWSEAPRGTPLFETIMAFENYPAHASFKGGSNGNALRVTELGSIEKVNYPLGFAVAPGDELLLQLSYDTAYFDRETIIDILQHLQTLLEDIAADPHRRLFELSLLTPAEKHQVLVEWNETTTQYPRHALVHQLFEEQVTLRPSAIAVSDENISLTYSELNERANQLAHHLQSLGVGPESLVGLCLERSPELIVAILATLKAGGAYMPLDQSYPAERIRLMCDDAQPRAIVTESSLRDLLPPSALLVSIDEEQEAIARYSKENLPAKGGGESLAQVIYTSGSTGKPKGVCITHRGINRLVLNTNYATFSSEDIIGQGANTSFDAATFEIWSALLNGAHLVILDREVMLSPWELQRRVRDEELTTLFLTTALFNQVARETPETFSTLKYVFFGGEAADPRSVKEVLERGMPEQLIHAYGPAESTTYATCHLVTDVPAGARTVPIGQPVANTDVYVLDQYLCPIPPGLTGEIYVGGDGLARGYLGQPDLTADRFVPHPFADGERLYRTGDLARLLADGAMEFAGRNDEQIKLRGFRIEPGEVESVLCRHSHVKEAAVIIREDVPRDKRLVGYYVPTRDAGPATVAELRAYLTESLPPYMVPAALVEINALPLTPNGKVDRNALPIPDWTQLPLLGNLVAPRTAEERVLVEVWSEVLGLNPEWVGIEDNFFELGGDSILSIQVVTRAVKRGVQLTPRHLFDHQTIATLAAAIGSSDDSAGEIVGEESATQSEQDESEVPLTPIQRWFFEQEQPDPHYFNQAVLLRTRPELSTNVLERALKLIVARHDALRLRFTVDEDGEWSQRVAAQDEGDPGVLWRRDLSRVPEGEEWDAEVKYESKRAQASLNLASGPLIRAVHLDAGAGRWGRLFIAIHHLAVDGVSWRVLLEELAEVTEAFMAEREPQLAQPTTTWAQWSRALVGTAGRSERELDYWSSLPWTKVSKLSVDKEGENAVASAQTLERTLTPEQTSELLTGVARVYRARVDEALLASLARAYPRWLSERGVDAHEDKGPGVLLVEMEGHGREAERTGLGLDLTRTTGWFTSLYPVAIELGDNDEDAGTTLRRVKELVRGVPSGGLGWGLLKYVCRGGGLTKVRRWPEAEVSMNYLGRFDNVVGEGGPFAGATEAIGPSQASGQRRTHLLSINSLVSGGRLQLLWTYSNTIHDRESVERLAELQLEELHAIIAQGQPLAATTAEATYPLTPMQELMVSESLAAPGTGLYTPQFSFSVEGKFDVPAFESAWQSVVSRHSIFRTSLNGKREQVVHKSANLRLEVHDWQGISRDEQRSRLDEFLKEDRTRGFDLAHPPLMRLTLIHLGPDSYQLVWLNHHMLLDGWSFGPVLTEVFAHYEAKLSGQSLRLPPARPFSDYVTWLSQHDEAGAERFWRHYLAGFTAATPLPASFDKRTGYGDAECRLTVEQTEAMRALARRSRVTLNTVVGGAWAVLLARSAGVEDVVYGAVVSGRPAELEGVEGMVGLFINTLPVRARVRDDALVEEWLRDLQREAAEARQYEFTSLAQVQRWSEIPAGTPLFNSILRFQNYPLDLSSNEEEATLRISADVAIDWWHYPICLVVTAGEEMSLRLSYRRDSLDEDAAAGVLNQLRSLLEELVYDATSAPLSRSSRALEAHS